MTNTCESFVDFCNRMTINQYDIVTEGALASIKNFVKNLLLKIIRGLKNLLSKGKDNKLKTSIRNLLTKAENALDKTNKATTEEQVNDVKEEAEELNKRMEEITKRIEEKKESSETPEQNQKLLKANPQQLQLPEKSSYSIERVKIHSTRKDEILKTISIKEAELEKRKEILDKLEEERESAQDRMYDFSDDYQDKHGKISASKLAKISPEFAKLRTEYYKADQRRFKYEDSQYAPLANEIHNLKAELKRM